jgi:NAD(P)-dependent dehydrogenase (short-subunit alcohol dehydrogenase family)
VGSTVFCDEMEKGTQGRYKCQQFPSSALGGEREQIEAVQLGTQDLVNTSTGPLGNFVPEVRIVDIPFLFRDYDHARKAMDGPIGQDLQKKMAAKGLINLAWTEDEFDRCYAVNVKSIYLSTIHTVPALRANGGGCLINIASTAGVRPRPGLTWYNGSKGAVITTSKSLAAEFGADNIRVNCVNPVMNPFTALGASFAGGELTEERLAKFRSSIPLGRFSTGDDVANAVLYLASDEAAFISGVCLEVDGARCV